MPPRVRKPLTSHNAVFYSFEFEQREAAVYCGYTWEQYQALPGIEAWVDPEKPTNSKSMVLAQYRIHSKIEAEKWLPDKDM